jgi:hypothetical protein
MAVYDERTAFFFLQLLRHGQEDNWTLVLSFGLTAETAFPSALRRHPPKNSSQRQFRPMGFFSTTAR